MEGISNISMKLPNFVAIVACLLLAASSAKDDGWQPYSDFLIDGLAGGLTDANTSLLSRDTLSVFQSGLGRRQQQCENAGYVPCTNVPGKCCPASDICLPGLGCCDSTYETCDGTGCYASGATCCDGYACASTDNCLLGKCCPKTSETCDGTGCWDSATCCDNGKVCKSSETCCSGGCMPNDEGNTCCSSGWCYPGTSCCEQAKKCCPTGSTCCPGTCCLEGYECAGNGECRELVSSASESTSTSSSAKTSDAPATSNPAMSTPKFSTPKAPTSTRSCVPPGPTNLSPDAISELPVVEFLYIDTDYEAFGDIVKSMCLGMQERNKTRGNIFNQDVLTYAGSKDPCYKDRRKDANCDGCCKGIKKDTGPFIGFPTQCDEYPFASTVEGGEGAHRSCVVGFENSLQGGRLSSFTSKLTYGQQFVVRVVGIQCSDVKESDLQGCRPGVKRRDMYGDGEPSSGYEASVRSIGDNVTKAVVIPFGDLGNGQYSSRLQIVDGQADRAAVISNAGTQLGSDFSLTDLSQAGASVDFSLDGGEYGVGALVYTSQSTLNVSFEFTNSLSNASPTPSTKASNASTNRSRLLIVFATFLAALLSSL